MRFRLGVAAACVATACLGLPVSAHAISSSHSDAQPNITCGMLVSASITLTHDLSCPETALFVQQDLNAPVDALTVDLAGHTVTSATEPPVVARDKAVTMTLKNGRLVTTDAQAAVEDEGHDNVYERITFDKGTIISVNDAFPHIFHCTFIHGASVFTDQNAADIEHNTFSDAGAPATSLSAALGAIALNSTGSTVIGNTITGYSTGISVSGDLASANVRENVLLRNGTGIQIVGVGNTLMSVTVKKNVAIANRGDGIVVGDSTNSDISRNTALLNGGDGVRIDPTPLFPGAPIALIAKLTRNVALANAKWGIEAPANSAHVAIVDGGRNIAHFNGVGQCLNLTCH
jgi:parallel beta-helix repeat protein